MDLAQNSLDSMLHVHGQTTETRQISCDDNITGQWLSSRDWETLWLSASSEHLAAQIEALQGQFLEALQALFAQENFAPQEKLKLYLSPQGTLVAEGDEDECRRISCLLDEHPEISRLFCRIAQLATLDHGLDLVRIACDALRQPEKDAVLESPFQRYCVSMKGPLSHFYLR